MLLVVPWLWSYWGSLWPKKKKIKLTHVINNFLIHVIAFSLKMQDFFFLNVSSHPKKDVDQYYIINGLVLPFMSGRNIQFHHNWLKTTQPPQKTFEIDIFLSSKCFCSIHLVPLSHFTNVFGEGDFRFIPFYAEYWVKSSKQQCNMTGELLYWVSRQSLTTDPLLKKKQITRIKVTKLQWRY